jgi:L-amino acid N-acyltransferase YncA
VIRPAGERDTGAIADIYNEGIATRLATFETEPRTAADVESWLAAGERLPTLVVEEDNAILGWGRILAYSDRPVYAGVGEVSVYVAEHARGRGLGRALLEELQKSARQLGYWKLVGKLFTANVASAGMVRSCGWREVGMHHKHSRLDGEWRDVRLVERVL